jgi:hypothetical protein
MHYNTTMQRDTALRVSPYESLYGAATTTETHLSWFTMIGTQYR